MLLGRAPPAHREYRRSIPLDGFPAPAALSFALAVFAGGTLSAIVGFVLPWAFRFAGSDPALGSGPICTIVQDVASLLIYLLMVRALVA